MTQEERAYNYASTRKGTKHQVGEIAKFYNDGYEQAEKDMMEQVMECELVCLKDRLLAVLPIKEFQWTVGDKIKIIIVKEDKS